MNTCEFCGKNTSNPRFCSRSCAAKLNNVTTPKRKTKKLCTVCGESVLSYRHTKCHIHHKEYLENKYESFKELTLKDYWDKKSLSNLHSSSKNTHIRALARSHFKHLIKKPCYLCGYNKHVELCHIKPISSYPETAKVKEVNSEENLIQLCPNCHWELDNGHVVLPKGFKPLL